MPIVMSVLSSACGNACNVKAEIIEIILSAHSDIRHHNYARKLQNISRQSLGHCLYTDSAVKNKVENLTGLRDSYFYLVY